jgi:outer membrane protein OmpA-like peptidoglycan-associated protein
MTCKRLRLFVFVFFGAVLAGCAGSKTSGTSATSPPEAETTATAIAVASTAAATTSAAGAVESAAASPAVEASGVSATSAGPTPEPTPTPYANLLSYLNGTIVVSYPTTLDGNPNDVDEHGASFKAGANGPFTFVYELPGVATLTSIDVWLPDAQPSAAPATITVAASTAEAGSGYSDIASLTATTGMKYPSTLAVADAKARWLRVTVNGPLPQPFHGIYAYGTLAPRPPAAPAVAGIYVQQQSPYDSGDGQFNGTPKPSDTDPWYVGVVAPAGGLGGQYCRKGSSGDPLAGTFDGRFWTLGTSRMVVNDEATLIAGNYSGTEFWSRSAAQPVYCKPRDGGGTGSTRVLVLDTSSDYARYPIGDAAKGVPGLSFTRLPAGLLDPAVLAKYQAVMLNGICKPATFLSQGQISGLLSWVQAGHKLLIYTADMCGGGSDFTFLPYPFTSSNPGAAGATSHNLIEVENDALGSLDAADKAHYFDPKPWAAANNQIGDADTVVTHDPHWCGHLFGTNVKNVNGFMQMYAVYGRGLIIDDGFDHDDDGNPGYEQMRRLELSTPVDGFLPCTQNVGLAFLIEPSSTAKFTPGKPQTVRAAMQLLANQGWKGHVTVATTGDFPAQVTPNSFDIAGGTQPLKVALHIPASAKPGTYAVIVNGTGNDGTKAQATVNLIATTPLVKQLKIQRRIRLYGIHFDVDSAHIQPQSEPVIKQIAQIMRDDPQWHFRVEGHTDSDGGVAHNQVLSQQRAESVVADLVKRYRIARSRLVPAGYGLSRPVASNATPAGKALNRRVELVRL